MKTSDFDFSLPKEFIARDPVVPRDNSRLFVYDSVKNKIYHRYFYDLPEYLSDEDVLVMNRSKVIPARIPVDFGSSSGEIFLLKELSDMQWRALIRPGRRFSLGDTVALGPEVTATVSSILDDGSRILDFKGNFSRFVDVLEDFGETPLPPYIKNSRADSGQYQTVYAKESGSVAAPTAGLHFTEKLFSQLDALGVQREELILHVGRGTFLPVSSNDLAGHKMHSEEYVLPDDVSSRLNECKRLGKKFVAVGTTSVRVLESSFKSGGFVPGSSETDIFIYPGGYQWKVVDNLITNFHLPKSTLIMLVASFLESKGVSDPIKRILGFYEVAKSEGYRFYSFGDAMLII